jgi:leucyl/phenylalanyl-tRNA---protein transferase
MYLLTEALYFPPVHTADAQGVLAIGGDLSPERLLLAYRSGIFPWYNADEPILWWSPNPRFVLLPAQLKITKSMQQVLRNKHFYFSINKDFAGVIRSCRQKERPGQDGTWITDAVEEAYNRLHQLGHAVSAEAWQNDKLVGGVYGIRQGNIFFGESMFSQVNNASKFAFIKLVQKLQAQGVVLIDCQVYTPHLESLGARMIDRTLFMDYLQKNIPLV